MADSPLPDLNGLTPLMAASTPAMDQIASEGRNGLFQTIETSITGIACNVTGVVYTGLLPITGIAPDSEIWMTAAVWITRATA